MKPALTALTARQVVDGEMPMVFAARMPAIAPRLRRSHARRCYARRGVARNAHLGTHRQAVYCMRPSSRLYITRHAASNSRLECAVRCAPRKEPRVSYIDT